MIDEYFHPWLIEVNTNPDITTSTVYLFVSLFFMLILQKPVCHRVIPAMVENALRIGLDPLFPAP